MVVCTSMYQNFLMGIQSVLTIIYHNQVGGNLVHKHEKIKIWRDGRTEPLQSISKSAEQIFQSEFPM